MEEKVYSIDEEVFYPLEEIMEDLRSQNDKGSKVEVLCGTPVKHTHLEFINGRRLLDSMMDESFEIAGEWAENYLANISNEKVEELEKALAAWMDENIKKPSFFTVKDVKEVTVIVD